jgi:ribonuclease HI
VDQKVYAQILACRLQRVFNLHPILSGSQAGFLESEGTAQNVKALIAAIRRLRAKKGTSALLFVDFRKAFDSIPWDVIEFALVQHGLPRAFCRAVMELYSEALSATVETSYGLTDPIAITQGVRQGCPLSPLLFNLAIDFLLRRLEHENRGFKWGRVWIPALAYADDVVLFCRDDARELLEILRDFCDFSGLCINPRKCALMPVHGPHPILMEDGIPIPVLEQGECYKYLGVWVNVQLNWEKQKQVLHQRVLARLKLLESLPATPSAKVEVINIFALSLLNYHMQMIQFPEKWLCDIQERACTAVKKGLLANRYPNYLITAPRGICGLGLWNLVRRQRALYINATLDKFYNSKNVLIRGIASAALTESVKLGRVVLSEDGRILPLAQMGADDTGDSPLRLAKVCTQEHAVWLAPVGVRQAVVEHTGRLVAQEGDDCVFTDGGRNETRITLGWAMVGPPQCSQNVKLPSVKPDISWAELLAIAMVPEMGTPCVRVFSDSQAAVKAVKSYAEAKDKDRRKTRLGNVLNWVNDRVGADNVHWMPAHTLDSSARGNPDKIDHLRQISRRLTVKVNKLQVGNALADRAAREWNHGDPEMTHLQLRERIRAMRPEGHSLEMEGWGAVAPPVKSFLKVNWECLDLANIRSKPAWGALWRLKDKVYWKATRLAWQPRNPTKRRFVAFAMNAVLGLQYAPRDRAYWEKDSWRSCWIEASACKSCPFCSDGPIPATASMEHILRDCACTKPHRDRQREGLVGLVDAIRLKVKAPLPDLPSILEDWLASPWTHGESDTECGWPQLGIIPNPRVSRDG